MNRKQTQQAFKEWRRNMTDMPEEQEEMALDAFLSGAAFGAGGLEEREGIPAHTADIESARFVEWADANPGDRSEREAFSGGFEAGMKWMQRVVDTEQFVQIEEPTGDFLGIIAVRGGTIDEIERVARSYFDALTEDEPDADDLAAALCGEGVTARRVYLESVCL